MKEPRWISKTLILAVHANQVREHGGSPGVRDKGLLESALSRPRNRFGYESGSDLCDLAASYGFGIARNHPFVDGNKRVAFQAMYIFLGLNGLRIDVPEEEVVALMLALASGELEESDLAAWLKGYTSPR